MVLSRSAISLTICALFAAVPKPVCAIYARAATTTAVDRYTARQKANAAPLFENGLEKRFQNGAAMCEWLRSACHEIKVPVLELDIEKRCERRALEDFAACLLSQCRPVPHAR